MEIKLKKINTIYILLLEGELDLYNATNVEKAFNIIIKKGATSVIVDFSNTSYIDSSGVGLLLKLNSLAKAQQLDFLLSGVNGEVLNVLKLTNLIKFFPQVDSYREGIKSLMVKEGQT